MLGLLVEGCSNQEIARTLVVTPRTVATHLEHVLTKLAAPTRTRAAVRAERDGLDVPPAPSAAVAFLSAIAQWGCNGPPAALHE